MYCYENVTKLAQQITTHKKFLSIGVLASGFGSNLQALIDFSKTPQSKFKIELVISNKATAFALKRAQQENIAHELVSHKNFSSRQEFEKKILKLLNKSQIKLIVLAGFMKILSSYFLDFYDKQVINIHPSLLPNYPGLDVIKKAYNNCEKNFGCTVHVVDTGVDTGPILGQLRYKKNNTDDLESITRQVHKIEHELYPKIIQNIALRVLQENSRIKIPA